jgi:hypothetical protein
MMVTATIRQHLQQEQLRLLHHPEGRLGVILLFFAISSAAFLSIPSASSFLIDISWNCEKSYLLRYITLNLLCKGSDSLVVPLLVVAAKWDIPGIVIASEMQKEGLDLNNEENLDSDLNTKIM